MADKPVENLVHEFLAAHVAELSASSDFELKPTAYDKRKKQTGIELGDADTSLLPNGNGDDMTEFDGLLAIEIFARVVDKDKTQRTEARQQVFDIKLKLLQLFEKYPTLDGRGCKVRVLRQVRFFDDTGADKYAIERVPIVLNPRDLKGD